MKYAFLFVAFLFGFLAGWAGDHPSFESGVYELCWVMVGVCATMAAVIAWDDQRRDWENSPE